MGVTDLKKRNQQSLQFYRGHGPRRRLPDWCYALLSQLPRRSSLSHSDSVWAKLSGSSILSQTGHYNGLHTLRLAFTSSVHIPSHSAFSLFLSLESFCTQNPSHSFLNISPITYAIGVILTPSSLPQPPSDAALCLASTLRGPQDGKRGSHVLLVECWLYYMWSPKNTSENIHRVKTCR